jgi:hypothetical protein
MDHLFPAKHPRRFYDNLKEHLWDYINHNPTKPTKLWYETQTVLPNVLKESTHARKTLIQLFQNPRPINLGEIVAPFQKEVVLLHVLYGRINLKTIRKGFGHFMTEMLERNYSYQFSRYDFDQYEVILRPAWDSIMICIEIRESEPSCPIPQEINPPPQIFQEALEQEKSVNFCNIEHKETVVLATRFAWKDNEAYPVQLAVKQVLPELLLMNTYVCPRTKLRNMAADVHGITEEMLRHATDHYAAYRELKTLLHDKVVVGYKIYRQLKRLKIDVNHLAAIKEIRRNPCFGSSNEGNGETCPWKLEQLQMPYSLHRFLFPIKSALDEATLIGSIYTSVYTRWQDDIPWKKNIPAEKERETPIKRKVIFEQEEIRRKRPSPEKVHPKITIEKSINNPQRKITIEGNTPITPQPTKGIIKPQIKSVVSRKEPQEQTPKQKSRVDLDADSADDEYEIDLTIDSDEYLSAQENLNVEGKTDIFKMPRIPRKEQPNRKKAKYVKPTIEPKRAMDEIDFTNDEVYYEETDQGLIENEKHQEFPRAREIATFLFDPNKLLSEQEIPQNRDLEIWLIPHGTIGIIKRKDVMIIPPIISPKRNTAYGGACLPSTHSHSSTSYRR